MHFDAAEAVPEMTLTGVYEAITTTWTPELDLLADSATDTHFVVEVESDGSAHLRFGDGTNGKRPDSGTVFTASYRIGNGTAGNVGAESLIFLVADPRIQSCTNPMPATGGTDPETTDQIRRRAPQAFLTQERAVTMADYAAIAERNSQVDAAVATLRWTGSWYTVFVTAEPKCAGNLTPDLRKALARNINRYRLAGQDIQLESPQYVSLEIELTVCVNPAYFQSDVEASLLEVLGNKVLPNGQRGLFYPDSFTFGQTVYLSPIYAAARKVAGVDSITATVFEPQGIRTTRYLDSGEIPLGPLQIARLENDPSLPDHGQLSLVMRGGK
jgi:predicted phage baseplate assembly protein